MNKANNKWAFNNLYDQVMDLSTYLIKISENQKFFQKRHQAET